ncbi:MAG: hypothetical protein J6X41_02675 [Spirochaetales bacterium]|nr:hypothetical protein [Spirochaetales bacterium]
MKKVLIVLALVALVLVPVAAEKATYVGGEVGYPMGVTFGFRGEKDWNLYLTAGLDVFSLGKQLYGDVVGGMELKVGSFEIGSEEFNMNAGAQVGLDFWAGDYKAMAISVRGTFGISYDWKDIDWTTYFRAGLGVRFKISGSDDAKVNLFSDSFVLGMVYHL